MRLFGVELRRLLARTAIVIVALVGLAGTVLVGWTAYSSAKPMTDAQLAEAEQYYQQELEYWEENGEQQIADCLEAQEAEAESTGEEVDFGCDQMEPQRDWFVWEPPGFGEYIAMNLPSSMLIVGLVSLLVGVTFVAAEFATGSIGTWLTFVPRRGPVFASKTAAAALAGLVYGLIWAAAFLAATAGGYLLAGSEVTITAPLIHTALKVGAVALAITAIGTGLAFVVRHTAAALGIAVAYLIAVDTIALPQLPGGGRWTLANNLAAWTTGRGTYYDEECTVEVSGTTCEYIEHTITQTQGGLVVLGLVLIVTAVAFLTFRRRDI